MQLTRRHPLRLLLVAVLAAAAAGCAPGLVYSRVTTPLDTNLDAIPYERRMSMDPVNSFRYIVRVDWGTNAIGDIAKKHGIETVYYADIERLYIWFGLWRQAWVRIYGVGPSPDDAVGT